MTSLRFSDQQLLIVISGPSGAGKDSVIKRLRERDSSLYFVVTTTDRKARGDEVHGRYYFFVSETEFTKMIDRDEFIEYATVYGQHKGVPKSQVRRALESGRDVVMRLDVQGAAKIRELHPKCLLIFLATESLDQLVNRLALRKSEPDESMKIRVETACGEMEQVDWFDYCVVNADDMLDECVDNILAILKAEHLRVA